MLLFRAIQENEVNIDEPTKQRMNWDTLIIHWYIYIIIYIHIYIYIYHHGDPSRQNIWDPPAGAKIYGYFNEPEAIEFVR
jgi:hypothetical protein